MFDFTHLGETVTDPTDISLVAPRRQSKGASQALSSSIAALTESSSKPRRKGFVEITKETPLSALSRFFEWNSAAVVTDRQSDGNLKPVAVVTKVDLLTWMVKAKKNQNGSVNGAH